MSKLEQQITLKTQSILLQQQAIQRRRSELYNGALDYCRQPATLVKSAVAGFVLGELFPPGGAKRARRDEQPGLPSVIAEQLAKILPLLLIETVRSSLTAILRGEASPPEQPQ